MKKLSTIYKELGIAFSFPIEITNAKGYVTYYEDSESYWQKWERDANGYLTYFEDSSGNQRGNPRSAKTCEGKVMELDGIKYKLPTIEEIKAL